MKTQNKVLLALAAATLSISANAGVANSKHNLGTTGTGTNHVTTGTGEVCVFCHTPHAANTSATAPLWNKSLPGTTYNTYDVDNSSSIDGSIAGGKDTVGSVSAACLSCHDGSQAMDVMINAPGSGGYNASGARATVNNDGVTPYTWTGADTLTGLPAVGAGGDLTNDHPIGIQYAGGGYSDSDTTASAGTGDSDFNAASTGTVNGTNVWWVDVASGTVGGTGFSGTAGTREKTDIQLYRRGTEPYVECASCHDPHQSDTNTFLRIDNTGSAVCLACHNK